MKLVKQYGFAFLLLFGFSASAQSNIKAAVDTKCQTCEDYLTVNNIEDFAAENCRIYQSICDLMTKRNAIILSEYRENKVYQAGETIEPSNVSVIMFLDGFAEIGQNVTPQMTLLDKNKKVIEVVETGYYQLYSFDENQNVVSAQGVKMIKRVDENSNQLMMTTINLSEVAKKAAYIQVILSFIHPKTMKIIELKRMIQTIDTK
jgi:hypothetical protein